MGGFAAKKYKKSTPIKKTVKEFVKKPEPATRKSLHEPGTSRKQPVQELPIAAPAPVPAETSKLISGPVAVPTKATKLAKASASPAYKTKTIAKKTPQISTFLYRRIIFLYIMLSFFLYFSIFFYF